MYELAFNINGERFEVPESAELWRPRRVRERGLEVVYERDGVAPLVLPIDTTAAEFRPAVGNVPGKYRLDALDAQHQPVEGVPPAYVVIQRVERTPSSEDGGDAPAPPPAATAAAPAHAPARCEAIALADRVIAVNADLTRVIAERFASVMEAAAHLIRAADGAGMPARLPPEPRNSAPIETTAGGDDDDGDDEPSGEEDVSDRIERITRNVAAAAEALGPLATLVVGKIGLRNAGAKKAPPRRHDAPRARRVDAPPRTVAAEPPSADAAPGAADCGDDADTTITPAMMGMLVQIRSRLEPEEVEFISQVYAELTPAEVAHWLRELSALSVDDAVARIREQIATAGRPEDDTLTADARQEAAS